MRKAGSRARYKHPNMDGHNLLSAAMKAYEVAVLPDEQVLKDIYAKFSEDDIKARYLKRSHCSTSSRR